MSGPLVEAAYFKPSCDRVVGPFLRLFGFGQVTIERNGKASGNHATYSNDNVLLDFSYWPEDFPTYSVMADIGLVEGLTISDRSLVGLWCAIPPDKREQTYFRNEEELVTVLSHIRDDILPTYAKPLWTDTQLLRQLITRTYSEHDAKIELGETVRKRAQAEMAFRDGNYEEAVRLYSELSAVDLTATDRKRIEIARKKLT